MDMVFQHTESDNMKKQIWKWMLVLALIVCFAAALPGLSAAADNIGDLIVGQDIGTMLIYASPLEIESCGLISGGLPNGLKLYWDATSVYLTGKPGTEGSYSAVYNIQTSEATVPVTLMIEEVNFSPFCGALSMPSTVPKTVAARARARAIQKDRLRMILRKSAVRSFLTVPAPFC